MAPTKAPTTTAINIIRTVGGSIGTAVLTVVLERRIAANIPGTTGKLGEIRGGGIARAAEPLAHAFGQTFWWALGLTALAFIPASFLPRRPASEAAAPPPPARAAPVADDA